MDGDEIVGLATFRFEITSNDNIDAIRFYLRRGLRLVAVHLAAIDEARKLKPSIPLVGENDIPIHDELEFELMLD